MGTIKESKLSEIFELMNRKIFLEEMIKDRTTVVEGYTIRINSIYGGMFLCPGESPAHETELNERADQQVSDIRDKIYVVQNTIDLINKELKDVTIRLFNLEKKEFYNGKEN